MGKRSAGIMRLIGARPGQVFTGMSVCALLAAGVSLAVGCIISYFLYDGICEAVFGAGGGEMSFSVPSGAYWGGGRACVHNGGLHVLFCKNGVRQSY